MATGPTLSMISQQGITHLSHVFTNAVEGQAGLVGDDVEVFTNSLRGFLDFIFEFGIRTRNNSRRQI